MSSSRESRPVSATPTLREDEPEKAPVKEPGNSVSHSVPSENAQGMTDVQNNSASDEDVEVEIVDWEGPDDPENPKK